MGLPNIYSCLLKSMSTLNDDTIYCEVSNDVIEMKKNRCYFDIKVSPPNENQHNNSKTDRKKAWKDV